MVNDHALQLLSEGDLHTVEEMAMQGKAGRDMNATPEWIAAWEKYDNACIAAMNAGDIRFTIAEMASYSTKADEKPRENTFRYLVLSSRPQPELTAYRVR